MSDPWPAFEPRPQLVALAVPALVRLRTPVLLADAANERAAGSSELALESAGALRLLDRARTRQPVHRRRAAHPTAALRSPISSLIATPRPWGLRARLSATVADSAEAVSAAWSRGGEAERRALGVPAHRPRPTKGAPHCRLGSEHGLAPPPCQQRRNTAATPCPRVRARARVPRQPAPRSVSDARCPRARCDRPAAPPAGPPRTAAPARGRPPENSMRDSCARGICQTYSR
jgi:hypothetical protein